MMESLPPEVVAACDRLAEAGGRAYMSSAAAYLRDSGHSVTPNPAAADAVLKGGAARVAEAAMKAVRAVLETEDSYDFAAAAYVAVFQLAGREVARRLIKKGLAVNVEAN